MSGNCRYDFFPQRFVWGGIIWACLPISKYILHGGGYLNPAPADASAWSYHLGPTPSPRPLISTRLKETGRKDLAACFM